MAETSTMIERARAAGSWTLRQATDEEWASRWDEFVARHPEATGYHRWGWKQAIERSFGWPTFYLLAERDGAVGGILPLVWQKSRLFGSFLTSLPFLNAGGALAEDAKAAAALVAEAVELARRMRARHLELRYRHRPQTALPLKTNKITLVRAVEADEEKMMAALPHKVRTDIRKAMKNDLEAEFGGAELLGHFYALFARNMRDLGTPVYAQKWFEEIFAALPAACHICLVRHRGRPVAASFLVGFRDTMEAIWSASDYDYAARKPNMFLYFKILCFAGAQGCRTFDFGRSSVGSGTHRFKKQWGTEEIPLYWAYWLPGGGELPELNPENPKYKLAIRVWQKLPVGVTKLLGPPIVRCLP